VTVSANPAASAMYTLDPAADLRPAGGDPIIEVPADIDPLPCVFLPLVLRQ